VHLLGGRVAELLIFNQLTTGAGNDLEQATNLARKMVCNWGMSDKIGPLTFGKKQEHIFLGKEISQARDYSEQTALEIDSEIKKLVVKSQTKAEELLSKNTGKLHVLAQALLEKECLTGEQIDEILKEFDQAETIAEEKD